MQEINPKKNPKILKKILIFFGGVTLLPNYQEASEGLLKEVISTEL